MPTYMRGYYKYVIIRLIIICIIIVFILLGESILDIMIKGIVIQEKSITLLPLISEDLLYNIESLGIKYNIKLVPEHIITSLEHANLTTFYDIRFKDIILDEKIMLYLEIEIIKQKVLICFFYIELLLSIIFIYFVKNFIKLMCTMRILTLIVIFIIIYQNKIWYQISLQICSTTINTYYFYFILIILYIILEYKQYNKVTKYKYYLLVFWVTCIIYFYCIYLINQQLFYNTHNISEYLLQTKIISIKYQFTLNYKQFFFYSSINNAILSLNVEHLREFYWDLFIALEMDTAENIYYKTLEEIRNTCNNFIIKNNRDIFIFDIMNSIATHYSDLEYIQLTVHSKLRTKFFIENLQKEYLLEWLLLFDWVDLIQRNGLNKNNIINELISEIETLKQINITYYTSSNVINEFKHQAFLSLTEMSRNLPPQYNKIALKIPSIIEETINYIDWKKYVLTADLVSGDMIFLKKFFLFRMQIHINDFFFTHKIYSCIAYITPYLEPITPYLKPITTSIPVSIDYFKDFASSLHEFQHKHIKITWNTNLFIIMKQIYNLVEGYESLRIYVPRNMLLVDYPPNALLIPIMEDLILTPSQEYLWIEKLNSDERLNFLINIFNCITHITIDDNAVYIYIGPICIIIS